MMRPSFARRGAILLAIASALAAPGGLRGQEEAARVSEVPPAPAGPEHAGVRSLIEELVAAFNAKNPEALEKLVTDGVILVDARGSTTSGRKAVLEHYAGVFSEAPKARIKDTLESVHQVADGVARGEGTFLLEDEPGIAEPTEGRFSILAVRRDDRWLLAELRDLPDPHSEGTDDENPLESLGWMIGRWVDETEDATISSEVRWALDGQFILRDYSVEIAGKKAVSGLMVVGYDPQARQIRSWVFDSAGSQGEAFWTRVNDSQWVLRARGRLRDGTPTSSSQVVTLMGADAVRQNSLDRTIGGELLPDVTEVIMVRRPPAPQSKGEDDPGKPGGTPARPPEPDNR